MLMLYLRSKTLPYRRFIKYHLFGVHHFSRRLPKKGDVLLSCCGVENYNAQKTVEYVSVFEDTIQYTDGTTDSITHCGWQPIPYNSHE